MECGQSFGYHVNALPIRNLENSFILGFLSPFCTPRMSRKDIMCSRVLPIQSNFLNVGGVYPCGYNFSSTTKAKGHSTSYTSTCPSLWMRSIFFNSSCVTHLLVVSLFQSCVFPHSFLHHLSMVAFSF